MPTPPKDKEKLKTLLDSVQSAISSIDSNPAAAKQQLQKTVTDYKAFCFSIKLVETQERD